ncbi:hypothetical protein DL96DRAFT_1595598 [Flagelloscypha sp. PMI_526]|nr:hypothetical protein DL96DRAFT_1595598 [Flagelloscypha sp. PMI_526]
MSGGAVAGVIIAVLVALAAFAVIVLRRRANAKRSQRRTWWSSRYGGGKEKDSLDSANATAGRNSVRSSFGTFGTSFDVSTPGHTSADTIIPAMPAMAEIRGGQPLYATSPETSVPPHDMAHQQMASPVSPPGTAAVDMRRVSAFSVGSINSDDSSHNPFLDPPLTPSAFPLPPSQFRPLATPITPNTPISPATTAVNAPAVTEFKEVETILRPFAPTLADELRVDVGNQVKIQQVFDDGWVAVESTANGHAEVGLIPVDCLRAKEQDLPAFLAAKRVSSYTVAAGMPHP